LNEKKFICEDVKARETRLEYLEKKLKYWESWKKFWNLNWKYFAIGGAIVGVIGGLFLANFLLGGAIWVGLCEAALACYTFAGGAATSVIS